MRSPSPQVPKSGANEPGPDGRSSGRRPRHRPALGWETLESRVLLSGATNSNEQEVERPFIRMLPPIELRAAEAGVLATDDQADTESDATLGTEVRRMWMGDPASNPLGIAFHDWFENFEPETHDGTIKTGAGSFPMGTAQYGQYGPSNLAGWDVVWEGNTLNDSLETAQTLPALGNYWVVGQFPSGDMTDAYRLPIKAEMVSLNMRVQMPDSGLGINHILIAYDAEGNELARWVSSASASIEASIEKSLLPPRLARELYFRVVSAVAPQDGETPPIPTGGDIAPTTPGAADGLDSSVYVIRIDGIMSGSDDGSDLPDPGVKNGGPTSGGSTSSNSSESSVVVFKTVVLPSSSLSSADEATETAVDEGGAIGLGGLPAQVAVPLGGTLGGGPATRSAFGTSSDGSGQVDVPDPDAIGADGEVPVDEALERLEAEGGVRVIRGAGGFPLMAAAAESRPRSLGAGLDLGPIDGSEPVMQLAVDLTMVRDRVRTCSDEAAEESNGYGLTGISYLGSAAGLAYGLFAPHLVPRRENRQDRIKIRFVQRLVRVLWPGRT